MFFHDLGGRMFKFISNFFNRFKRKSTNKVTQLKIDLYKDNNRCHYCDEKIYTFEDASLDHIIPVSKGGETNHHNCTISCKKCNTLKSDTNYDTFKSIVYDTTTRDRYWSLCEKKINNNIRIDILYPHLKEKYREYEILKSKHEESKKRLEVVFGSKHKTILDLKIKIKNIDKELYNLRNKIRNYKKDMDKSYDF